MKFVQNREKNWPKCNIVAKFYLIDEMIFVITFVTGSDEYNYFFGIVFVVVKRCLEQERSFLLLFFLYWFYKTRKYICDLDFSTFDKSNIDENNYFVLLDRYKVRNKSNAESTVILFNSLW